jgi:UDPglucose--hexose-1-phosphate uridylyltransferase
MKSNNEFRKDYLTGRWVIFAIGRKKRPSDFAVSRSEASTKKCAFCPGREHLTPPANLLYLRRGYRIVKSRDVGRHRRPGWVIRCIPNLYPALIQEPPRSTQNEIRTQYPFMKRLGIGVHEIVIESPIHDDHPHRASQRQIALGLQAEIERIRALGRIRSIKSVVLFRNHGHEAGASIAHAHSQIIATPIIPDRIEQEHKAMKKSFNRKGCAFCRISKAESRSKRAILRTRHFSVFAPWASIYPFEFWIVPRKHSSTIVNSSKNEINDLAYAIHCSFGALARALADPPYNSVFHLGPSRSRDDAFHWHIEVYPKLSVHAGFELGTGIYINTMLPEEAAKALASKIQ